MLKPLSCLLAMFLVATTLAQAAVADDWIVSKEGVRIPNPSPQPNESCSWTGGKDAGGKAHGSGLVIWFRNGEVQQVHTAHYEHGVAHGLFVLLSSDAEVGAAAFDRGEPIAVKLSVEREDERVPPKPRPCEYCHGSGKCRACGGAGQTSCLVCGSTGKIDQFNAASIYNDDAPTFIKVPCPYCFGGKKTCSICKGTTICTHCKGQRTSK